MIRKSPAFLRARSHHEHLPKGSDLARLARANLRIPRIEIRDRELVIICDSLACRADLDIMKPVAVADHAGLDGQRRRHTITGVGRRGRRSRGFYEISAGS